MTGVARAEKTDGKRTIIVAMDRAIAYDKLAPEDRFVRMRARRVAEAKVEQGLPPFPDLASRSPSREEARARRAGSRGPPVFDIPFIDRPIVDYRATLTAGRERIKRLTKECAAREGRRRYSKLADLLSHSC